MIAGTTSFSAFATMPNGTVVIGNKSFDLAYANDIANLTEIMNAIIVGGEVYVKDFSGNWIENNTGNIVDASVIPGEDVGQVEPLVVGSAGAINITKNIGDIYVLPSTVTVTLANLTTKELAVTWDKVAETKAGGEFTFTGTLTMVDGVVNSNNVTIIAKLTVSTTNPSSINVNGNGNLVNSGTACIQGDYIFYKNNDYKLYKSKLDGSDSIKLSDERAFNITVVGDWVYYTNGDNKIYKVKTDGTNNTKISDDIDDIGSFYVSDNYIYYNVIINGAYANIFKITIDGNNKTEINEDVSTNIIISGDWIYYLASYDNGTATDYSIYKVKTDGTYRTQLSFSDEVISSFNVIDDNIYYCSQGEICKMTTNGEDKSLIYEGDDIGISINVSGDWIYFDDIFNANLIRIKSDGTNKTVLCNDWPMHINVVGDWIYYLKYDGRYGDNKFYKIQTDGSDKQLVK